MCLECDGYSHEAAMQALDLQIRVHGWALIHVQDDDSPWTYTIGLLENHGHPELVVMDVEPELQSSIVRQLVGGITTRGSLPSGLMVVQGLRCVEVHQAHLQGHLFGRWSARYGTRLRPGEMLQVVLPDSMFCECHATAVHRLDRPGPSPTAPRGPNRAERRRKGRRGHAA